MNEENREDTLQRNFYARAVSRDVWVSVNLLNADKDIGVLL